MKMGQQRNARPGTLSRGQPWYDMVVGTYERTASGITIAYTECKEPVAQSKEGSMPQDMMEDACSRDVAEMRPMVQEQSRPLTYDEKKAAEAAFRGEPFNPAWSSAAAKVYAGIVDAMGKNQPSACSPTENTADWAIV
jgi:hypothetical protein